MTVRKYSSGKYNKNSHPVTLYETSRTHQSVVDVSRVKKMMETVHQATVTAVTGRRVPLRNLYQR